MLRFIITLIICWYAFSLLARFVFPVLLRFLFKKATENSFGTSNQKQQNQKEGEVTLSYKPKTETQFGEEGDYVDFEEVK
jgi:hypothetical protein